jgi:hypothetical protein
VKVDTNQHIQHISFKVQNFEEEEKKNSISCEKNLAEVGMPMD